MNELNQVLFLTGIYISGFLYLLPFGNIIDKKLVSLISFFVGLIVWVEAVVINLAISNNLRLEILLIIVIFGFFIINVIVRLLGIHIPWWRTIKKIHGLFLLFFIGITIICSFFLNYIHFSVDSQVYEGMARLLTNYGVVGPEHPYIFEWQVHARLIFIPGIHAVSHLFNIEVFYALYPVSSIMFIATFFWFINNNLKNMKINHLIRISMGVGGVLLLCTSILFIAHSFFLHTNLMTSIYFSLGTIFFYKYISQKGKFWLVLSIIFFAATIQIRKEMAIFSLPPILYILQNDSELERTYVLGLYGLFMFFYNWIFLMISMHGFQLGEARGGFMIYLICFALMTMMFFSSLSIRWRIFIKKHLFSLIISTVVGVIFLFLTFSEKLIPAFISLLKFLYIPRFGAWGGFWFGFSIVVILYITNLSIKTEKLGFLLFSIFYFFVLRLVLYGFFSGIKDNYWSTSGNRIILHIFPTAIFFMVMVFIELHASKLPSSQGFFSRSYGRKA